MTFEFRITRRVLVEAANVVDAERAVAEAVREGVPYAAKGEAFGEPWTLTEEGDPAVSKVVGPRGKTKGQTTK